MTPLGEQCCNTHSQDGTPLAETQLPRQDQQYKGTQAESADPDGEGASLGSSSDCTLNLGVILGRSFPSEPRNLRLQMTGGECGRWVPHMGAQPKSEFVRRCLGLNVCLLPKFIG